MARKPKDEPMSKIIFKANLGLMNVVKISREMAEASPSEACYHAETEDLAWDIIEECCLIGITTAAKIVVTAEERLAKAQSDAADASKDYLSYTTNRRNADAVKK